MTVKAEFLFDMINLWVVFYGQFESFVFVICSIEIQWKKLKGEKNRKLFLTERAPFRILFIFWRLKNLFSFVILFSTFVYWFRRSSSVYKFQSSRKIFYLFLPLISKSTRRWQYLRTPKIAIYYFVFGTSFNEVGWMNFFRAGLEIFRKTLWRNWKGNS